MDMETPEEDLAALDELARTVGQYQSCPTKILEIGSWAGRTALSLANGGPHRVVHCIDHWHGNAHDRMVQQVPRTPKEAFQTFCRNIGPDLLYKRVWPHVGHSLTYAAVWPYPMDLIFIDGDHRYSYVKADILAWQHHVRDNGILCGHDYGVADLPGVKQAVDEVFGDRPQRAGRFIWWVRL